MFLIQRSGALFETPGPRQTGTPGDAKFYESLTATDVKSAVAEILARVCP
ncbi:MAG TPA: hypothetical protein VJV79_02485 [Polyangiaceae bacterium]|nr:hypothetical protein [Polyangiaceae bacterium]